MALITPNCHEFGFFPDNSMSKYEPNANQRKESTAAASGRGEDGEHDGQKTEANSTLSTEGRRRAEKYPSTTAKNSRDACHFALGNPYASTIFASYSSSLAR